MNQNYGIVQTFLVVAVITLTATVQACPAIDEDGGRVVYEATARWTYEFIDVEPLPKLELRMLRAAAGNITESIRPRRVDEFVLDPGNIELNTINTDPALFHVLNTMKRELFEDDFRIADFGLGGQTVADCDAILSRLCSDYMGDLAVNTARQIAFDLLMESVPVPHSVAKHTLRIMFNLYRTGEGMNDEQAERLAQWARDNGSDLSADIFLQFYQTYRLFIEQQLQNQVVNLVFTEEECTWVFYTDWNLRTGELILRLIKTVGDVPVRRHPRFRPNSASPGDMNVSLGNLQVLNRNMLPENIANVTPFGLNAVADGPPRVVAGGPNPTIHFDVKKPLKDRRNGYSIDLDFRLADRSTVTTRGNFIIENVAPVILGLDPAAIEVEPGKRTVLATQITVQDDNADRWGADEIEANIRFHRLTRHPLDLRTGRPFTRWEHINLLAPPDPNGIFRFQLQSSSEAIEYPHRHGDFMGQLQVSDDNSETVLSDFTVTVKDMPPELLNFKVEPAYVHKRETNTFKITGFIRDENGIENPPDPDDIESVSIDATLAGGQIYSYADLIQSNRDKALVQVSTPEWRHSFNEAGHFAIPIEVRDGSHTITEMVEVYVGNTTPEATVWGYMRRINTTTFENEWHACPREQFRVGIIVRDREGDDLTVFARVVGEDVSVPLQQEDGNVTYTGELAAPAEPGEYTVEFTYFETGTDLTDAHHQTLPLEVQNCDDGTRPRLVIQSGRWRVQPDGFENYMDTEMNYAGQLYDWFSGPDNIKMGGPAGPVRFGIEYEPIEIRPVVGVIARFGFFIYLLPDGSVEFQEDYSGTLNENPKTLSQTGAAAILAASREDEYSQRFKFSAKALSYGLLTHVELGRCRFIPYPVSAELSLGVNQASMSIVHDYLFNADAGFANFTFDRVQKVKQSVASLEMGLGISISPIKNLHVGLGMTFGKTLFDKWKGTRKDIQTYDYLQDDLDRTETSEVKGQLWTYTTTDLYGQDFTQLEVLEEKPAEETRPGSPEVFLNRFGIRLTVSYALPFGLGIRL